MNEIPEGIRTKALDLGLSIETSRLRTIGDHSVRRYRFTDPATGYDSPWMSLARSHVWLDEREKETGS